MKIIAARDAILDFKPSAAPIVAHFHKRYKEI